MSLSLSPHFILVLHNPMILLVLFLFLYLSIYRLTICKCLVLALLFLCRCIHIVHEYNNYLRLLPLQRPCLYIHLYQLLIEIFQLHCIEVITVDDDAKLKS